MITRSDYIVELGPGSGARGGKIVSSAPTEEFMKSAQTLTSDDLPGRQVIHVPRGRRSGSGRSIAVKGASGNNLKDIDLTIPLKTMTCVTGVSGSGKSTLVVDTLYNILAAPFGEKCESALPFRSIKGLGDISGAKLIDQGPIGRAPRANP